MSATRAELVDAATDLNNVVLAPDDPIDVTLSVAEIRKGLREAAEFVRPEDALQEATRRVLAEVAGAAPPEDAAAEENAEDVLAEDTESEVQPEAEVASAKPEQAAEKSAARPRGRPRKDASASPAAVAPKREKKAVASVKETSKVKKTKAEAVKPAARTRVSRGEQNIGEFKPVRSGTKYEIMMRMAIKSMPIADIVKAIGKDDLTAYRPFAFLLRRDHGIDFSVKDGIASLILPKGKTVDDCVAAK